MLQQTTKFLGLSCKHCLIPTVSPYLPYFRRGRYYLEFEFVSREYVNYGRYEGRQYLNERREKETKNIY